MRISPAQSALLNARERELLASSGPYEVKRLVALIKRTRELRDKQRDLAQRHRIAAAGRSGSKASATVLRTRQKEKLFDRALRHYEMQLDRLDSECRAAVAELGMGRRAGTTARKTAKAPARKTAKAKTPAGKLPRSRIAERAVLKHQVRAH